MQAPLQKKTEIKVYILYVMKNIGYGVDFNTLNDALSSDGLIDYFSFTECFSELVDTGNVVSLEEGGKEVFLISEQGIHVADNLLYLLIPGVQRTALACATRLSSFDKKGAVISSGYTEADNGYIYTFKVEEKGAQRFFLELRLENKEQVQRIETNLKTHPDGIYKSIMALLNGEANYLL